MNKDMNIINMPIKDIKPYEKNAKKHDKTQIANVAESIKRFGFAQPLVVDKDNVLIIGHCRLLAAKQLKLREVPVLRLEELTEEEVKQLRLLDNKLNESDWDVDLLMDEVGELEWDGFNIDWDFPIEGIDDRTSPSVSGSLADKFIVPPFSVIQIANGRWQERKKAWIEFGIRSETGRGSYADIDEREDN